MAAIIQTDIIVIVVELSFCDNLSPENCTNRIFGPTINIRTFADGHVQHRCHKTPNISHSARPVFDWAFPEIRRFAISVIDARMFSIHAHNI
jgi:hypothetical protein